MQPAPSAPPPPRADLGKAGKGCIDGAAWSGGSRVLDRGLGRRRTKAKPSPALVHPGKRALRAACPWLVLLAALRCPGEAARREAAPRPFSPNPRAHARTKLCVRARGPRIRGAQHQFLRGPLGPTKGVTCCKVFRCREPPHGARNETDGKPCEVRTVKEVGVKGAQGRVCRCAAGPVLPARRGA